MNTTAKTFGMDGIDPDFVNALCPDDLDRLLPKMEPIFERLPCLKDVRIKSVVNGPIAYAADAGPLVGKHPGRRNLWSMNGIRVGIGEGGGYGKMLAQMMVHGETEWDTWQLDPRRITSFANTEYTALKSMEDYQHEFQWHMPHEHRPAARPAKTTPLYPVLEAKGAVFGVVNGWERTSFFKPSPDFVEDHSYAFCNWHDVVAQEVEAVQTRVGIAELSGFNRFDITGSGATAWIDNLTCTKLPKATGRVGLCYFLSNNGNIDTEASVATFSDDHLWYCSAAAACPRTSFAQPEFPWTSAQTCFVGHVETAVMAVSFSGEHAFEVHVPNIQLHAAYIALTKAGAPFGLSHFGSYAIDSMRMEKGYGHWKADFITEFNPIEAGVGRFVDHTKDFHGKDGLERQIALGNRRERVLIDIDSKAAPAHAGETVFDGGTPVGTVTSAAWGYRTNRTLAMAYVDPSQAQIGTKLTAHLIGKATTATMIAPCLYDPDHPVPRGTST